MPRRSPYTEEQKVNILEAVKSGGKAEKTWPEILIAATEVGYRGGLHYLMKMASNAGAVRRKRKSGKVAKPVVVAKGKRGRPRESKNSVKRGARIPNVAAGTGLGEIDKIVATMVEQRVAKAISRAVASVEQATNALRNL